MDFTIKTFSTLPLLFFSEISYNRDMATGMSFGGCINELSGTVSRMAAGDLF